MLAAKVYAFAFGAYTLTAARAVVGVSLPGILGPKSKNSGVSYRPSFRGSDELYLSFQESNEQNRPIAPTNYVRRGTSEMGFFVTALAVRSQHHQVHRVVFRYVANLLVGHATPNGRFHSANRRRRCVQQPI